MNRAILIAAALVVAAGCGTVVIDEQGRVVGDGAAQGDGGAWSVSTSSVSVSSSSGTGGDSVASGELIHEAKTLISSMVCDEMSLFWAEPANHAVMSSDLNGGDVHMVAPVTAFAHPAIFQAGPSLYMAVDQRDTRVERLLKTGGAALILMRTPGISALFVDYRGEVYWGDADRVRVRDGQVIDRAGSVRDIWADESNIWWSNAAGNVFRADHESGVGTMIGEAHTVGGGLGLVRADVYLAAASSDGLMLFPDSGPLRGRLSMSTHSVSSTTRGLAWVEESSDTGSRSLWISDLTGDAAQPVATHPQIESAIECAGRMYWWTSTGEVRREVR